MTTLKNIFALFILSSVLTSSAMDSRQLLKYGIVALGAGCAGALCMNHFNKKQNELLEKKINESEEKFIKLLVNFERKTANRINGLHIHWVMDRGSIDTLSPAQEVYRECIKKFVLKDDFESRNKELKPFFERLSKENEERIIAALVPMIQRHILAPAFYKSLAGSRDENSEDYADDFDSGDEAELIATGNDVVESHMPAIIVKTAESPRDDQRATRFVGKTKKKIFQRTQFEDISK